MINGAKAPDLPDYPFNSQLKLTAINTPSFGGQLKLTAINTPSFRGSFMRGIFPKNRLSWCYRSLSSLRPGPFPFRTIIIFDLPMVCREASAMEVPPVK